ncbi:MAG TPA: alkaline phosphatase family protein, partial [Pirellulales bacterium]
MRRSVLSSWERAAARGRTCHGKRLARTLALVALVTAAMGGSRSAHAEKQAPPPEYVIQISVDGLGSAWLEPLLKAGDLPNFERLEREGAWTHNARTDYDLTITLPNHTCMVTGRPVRDRSIGNRAFAGHGWTVNNDDQPENLHG